MNNIKRKVQFNSFSIWLFLGVIMLIVQLILGGITRLTGSGLSITEWQLVTGIIPPISEAKWQSEFYLYKQTPQYHYLNFEFSLNDFKKIYFWEWLHRFWARLIGLVFVFGMIYFIIKKKIKKSWLVNLFIMFLLGALQGLVGWIMVLSGLNGKEVYVHPLKLAIHFIFAFVLIGYVFWSSLILNSDNIKATNFNKKGFTIYIIMIGLILIQSGLGAMLAGSKAAAVAASFPSLNGIWFPFGVDFNNSNGLLLKFHFFHRILAYLLFLIFMYWCFILKPRATKNKKIIFFLVFLQVVLGITSVLTSPSININQWGIFQTLAICHQCNSLIIFIFIVFLLYHKIYNE